MQPYATHLLFDWTSASWEEAEAEVHRWADRQGNGIDPLIVPAVVGLNLSGIRTIQSCEGHLDSGFAYPWVMFERPLCPCYASEWQASQADSGHSELEAYHASDRLREAMAVCLHRPAEALRLASLLATFYTASSASLAHLTIDYTGATFYRLIPVVADTQMIDKRETLVRCQAEMARFALFLKAHVTVTPEHYLQKSVAQSALRRNYP